MDLAREYTVATQVVWPRPKHMDGFDKFLQFTDYDKLVLHRYMFLVPEKIHHKTTLYEVIKFLSQVSVRNFCLKSPPKIYMYLVNLCKILVILQS